ncbi:subtilase family protein, partial [mine drainage metagenome]
YLTVENTLLEQLNAVGVTNFFASGDYSGAEFLAANQAGMPAISPGSTSVGGGQTTAESNGVVYPVTNNVVCPSGYSYIGGGECIITGFPASYCDFGYCVPASYVAPATGLASFTYWSYGEGIGGTYNGIVGGGFGQSIGEQQPWYQNALDSYSTGAAIDPVVSGPAAFNMTIYEQLYGGWLENYGGTSFATPTMAGEWALIEEQANVAYGTPKMGGHQPDALRRAQRQ